MQSRSLKSHIKVKREDIVDSASHGHLNSSKREQNDLNCSAFPGNALQEPIDVTSEDDHGMEEGDNEACENAQNQLVVYDPAANGTGDLTGYQLPLLRYPNQSSRVLPSVGAFTAQCANCFKWRLIPTKEKYEEIREHFLEHPFLCKSAREWRPDVSCDDPADIVQDGSRLWAIDKPNIAQPPPGWERLLRIRGEGSTKFADVYYIAPSGKRLRSMVEIQKYLEEHPDYLKEGVRMSQFSFQIPRPLQENYVRKRPARYVDLQDGSHFGMQGSPEPSEVRPIAWAGPDENRREIQVDGDVNRSSAKKQRKRAVHSKETPTEQMCDGESL